MKNLLKGAFIFTIVLLVFCLFIWAMSSIAKQNTESSIKFYSECKERTNDIEWCVEHVYSIKVKK